MLRGTRVWKDYKLKNSPFNEISNEWYYDFLLIVPTILLIVNLMSSTSLNGVAISLMDYFYILLFARYIYLYREFLDSKAINSKNPGNFDDIKDKVMDTADDIKDMVVDTAKDVKDKVDDFVEDNKIDEKVDSVKDKVVDTAKDIKDKVDDFVEDNKPKKKKKKKKKKTNEKGSE